MEALIQRFSTDGTLDVAAVSEHDVEGILRVIASAAATNPAAACNASARRSFRFLVALYTVQPLEVTEPMTAMLDVLTKSVAAQITPVAKGARAWQPTNPAATSALRLLLRLRLERSHASLTHFAPLTIRADLAPFGTHPSPASIAAALEHARCIVNNTPKPEDPAARVAAALLVPQAAATTIMVELLSVEPFGPKPRVVGSAPQAVTMTGKKASTFSVGDRLPSYLPDHLNHPYVVAIAAICVRALASTSDEHERETADADFVGVVKDYLDRLSERLTDFVETTTAPIGVSSSANHPDVNWVAGLAVFVSDTLLQLQRLLPRSSTLTHEYNASALLSTVLGARRSAAERLLVDAAPEYRTFDQPIMRVDSGSDVPSVPLISGALRLSVATEAARHHAGVIRKPSQPLSLDAAAATLEAALDHAFDAPEPVPGLVAHIYALLARQPSELIQVVVRNWSSRLLVLACQQPHAAVPLVRLVASVCAFEGGLWLSDCFLRLSFFPVMTFAAECDVRCEGPDSDAGARHVVAKALNALGAPSSVQSAPLAFQALSEAPASSTAEAWAALSHAAFSPMSVRMSAAARLVPPLVRELSRVIADPRAIPMSFMADVLTAMRFTILPENMHAVGLDVIRRIAKTILMSAPLAVIEAAVAPVIDLLSHGVSELLATNAMTDVATWAVSTLSMLLAKFKAEAIAAPTATFFDKLHEVMWDVIPLLTLPQTHEGRWKQSGASEALDVALAHPLRDSALSSGLAQASDFEEYVRPSAQRERPTAVQLLHCCVTSMASLASVDAAFAERAPVAAKNVWTATREVAPDVAQACVACVAVCGRGTEHNGTYSLSKLFGVSSATS